MLYLTTVIFRYTVRKKLEIAASILGGIAFIIVIFFFMGGGDMIKSIFESKEKIARERRLEAEARAKEAQYNAEASRTPRL